MWHLSCCLIHITETAEEKLQSKYQRALRAVCSLRHTGPEEKDDNATSKSAPHQEEHVLLPPGKASSAGPELVARFKQKIIKFEVMMNVRCQASRSTCRSGSSPVMLVSVGHSPVLTQEVCSYKTSPKLSWKASLWVESRSTVPLARHSNNY